MRDLERFVILQVVDTRWREHLENMDYLREGVHLRAMAQKDPLVEYTAEGHAMFLELNARDPRGGAGAPVPRAARAGGRRGAAARAGGQALAAGNGGLSYEHESVAGAAAIAGAPRRRGMDPTGGWSARVQRPQQRMVGEHEKLGRNDPCWCGSGKKYKKCHGA